jgi:gamma-glutamyltranspeptidase/glutathione hydrolase
LAAGLLWASVAGTGAALIAQSPIQPCNATPAPAWCSAVSGDRSEGWGPQRRSEVMARNGIVATSQPLAAQAGLDILKKGGNAIDAAVATAAVLSVVEPMNVGPAGDLFAIIYIARENKLYTLNASGKAPTGATLERMNSLGYSWDSANWGPGSANPRPCSSVSIRRAGPRSTRP